MLLTHFLSRQRGAAHALPWGEKGTWESETAGREREQVHQFDCQSPPSSSAVPDRKSDALQRVC